MGFLRRLMNVCTSKRQRVNDFIHKRTQCFHTLGSKQELQVKFYRETDTNG